jgi:hypothetical protein
MKRHRGVSATLSPVGEVGLQSPDVLLAELEQLRQEVVAEAD